ncbi:LAO/AO transport system kinase [Roseiarcus fermentans]|uniref:LAO/AO transport system kinase n=1 Tax=Roseiarcus fermentans TaxID=1473586 RepID=A0A366FVV8_9HYPH|nr:methylmalonyl Co-A mutase-associated GTPase MeaB [Roseiarcus fermentans]RBP18170.1 LAO/AO transport system kinase [Roseiarcus fermentans]
MDARWSSPDIPPALVALVDRLRRGEAAALARCLSLVEQGGAHADAIGRLIGAASGRAIVVGFTGPPGAGKSTLIDAFVGHVRAGGRTVAVAAVDPSSPISGGSVLGDRIRMQRHTEDPGVFIRSIASRGHVGGLTETIHRVLDLMGASGRDLIVLETVGAGQSEVEIAEAADVCVVVNAPGLGDEVQALKAGILEIADILVVNKADLPSARRTADQLRAMLTLRADARDTPVIETIATSGAGVAALAAAVEARAELPAEQKRARRLRRVRRLIAQAAGRAIRDRILGLDDPRSDAALEAALEGRCGVAEAAERVLRLLAYPAPPAPAGAPSPVTGRPDAPPGERSPPPSCPSVIPPYGK